MKKTKPHLHAASFHFVNRKIREKYITDLTANMINYLYLCKSKIKFSICKTYI